MQHHHHGLAPEQCLGQAEGRLRNQGRMTFRAKQRCLVMVPPPQVTVQPVQGLHLGTGNLKDRTGTLSKCMTDLDNVPNQLVGKIM